MCFLIHSLSLLSSGYKVTLELNMIDKVFGILIQVVLNTRIGSKYMYLYSSTYFHVLILGV